MNKLYDMIIWNNNTTPALNEDNLNAMSQAINDIDDRVVMLGSDVLTVIPQIQAYLDQAEDLVAAMEALSQNPPYIGANGNWWVWDTETEQFVDSGIDASITVTIADVTAIAPDATPYITNTGTNTDPIFHLFIPRGQTGTAGQDGVSPAVTVTTITGGHRITITDADHPSGQSFDVMDGSGTGDMQASVYDPQSVVANAGGIPNYAAGLTDLAPAFSDQTAYAIGDYVSYQGAIYRFVSAHSAGAWSSSDVLEVAVCSDLKNKVGADAADYVINADSVNGDSGGGLIKKNDGRVTAYIYNVYKTTANVGLAYYSSVVFGTNTASSKGVKSARCSQYMMQSDSVTLSTSADTDVVFTNSSHFKSSYSDKIMFNVYTNIDGINPKSRSMNVSNNTFTVTFPPQPSAVTIKVMITFDIYRE